MDDMEYYKIKRNRCRYSKPDFKGFDKGIQYNCARDGMQDDKIILDISEEGCETCPHFLSKFIEYPITVSAIDVKNDDYSLYKADIGKWVKVRPCGKEYGEKTYLGIFLGDLPQSPHISHNNKTNVLTVMPMMNPAMFVPELKKIIYGCESWWSLIEKPEDVGKEITDETINNQWYVQALKAMCGGNSNDN